MPYPVLRLPSLEMPRLKTSFLVSAFLAMVALFGLASRADAQCTGTGPYTCTGPAISVPGGSTAAVAKTVSGLPTGAVQSMYVVLNGVTSNGGCSINSSYSSLAYASFLLTAPNGQKFQFLGASGNGFDGAGCGLTGQNLTIQDGGAAAPDNGATGYPSTPTSQTYGPSSYFKTLDSGENPPQGNSSQWPQTDGSATFAGQFAGTTANGTWTLTLQDVNPATSGDPVSVSSWSIVVTMEPVSNVNTTTTLTSNPNPSFTSGGNSSVTLTANVTATGTPTGAVLFTDGGNNLTCGGGNPAPLSSGTAICVMAFSTEGVHALSAGYGGTTGFNPSTGTANQLVEHPTTHPGGDEYCNTGALTNNGETTSPYPSIINVPSLGGTVANVSVTLNGFTASSGVPLDYGFLLVAPDGTHNLDFLDDAGVSGTAQSAVNMTIADGGAVPPVNGGLLAATYEPTDYESGAPSFPASTSPAPSLPGTINYAQPDTFSNNPMTLTQAFEGAGTTGEWSLFLLNNGGSSTPMSLTGGWCVTFEVNNGVATTTTLASSENPAFVGDSATVTATVKSGGSPVTSGTVTIVDTTTGNTLLSNGALSGSGTVAVNVGSLVEGDHELTATYSGVNEEFDPSTGTLWQRMDKRSTVTGIGTAASPAVVCNTGGFVLPGAADNIGAANVNPTNVFVSNLPGTLNSVEVELNGFHTTDPTIFDTASLLVGPNGKGLDFFSGAGNGNTILATGNYDFADSANGLAGQASSLPPGSYQPSSYDPTDTFTPNASSQYTLPGTIDYSAPHSNPFTLNSTNGLFGDINPNGVWSLYFYQNIHDTGAGATGWCLSFIENLPIVQITAAHGGGNFTQGETNAPITVDIANQGPGSTGDASGSNPIKVIDVLNPAFTFASGSGSGWTCSASSQTVTCTNDDSVASGSSYPTLTIDVNVSGTAGSPISNTATAIGGTGGILGTATSTDSITVNPAPVLAVSKTAVGTFTQGSTGQWDIVVSNVAASGATSGTVTVSDTMPSGYTITSTVTGPAFNCSTSTQTVLTCTSSTAVAGGSSFPTISVHVNIPAASPISVTNTANAWGGGDPNHTSLGTAATGFSTVTVVQTAATVTVSAGNNQSAPVGTAFATNLAVTVKDANSVAINGATVTFTAPGSGASGTFATSNTATTNAAGLATANVFTANGTPGAYTVGAAAGSATANFSLTNTQAPTITSGNSTTFTQNTAGTFTVTTTGFPKPALSKSGTLPTNVTFTDNGDGTATIAGTPSNSGTFQITITASNGVAPNGTQLFTLTVNAATVQVPNVVGDTLAAATTAIQGAGLVVGTTTSQYSGTVPAGDVISENPASGQTVNIGSSVNLVISNGPQPVLNSIQVTSASSTSSLGGAFSFTVTAYDQFSNVFTGYTGTVIVSSTDTTATLPGSYTFVPADAGTHNFSITFNSAGSWTITATDLASSIAGTSGSITVSVPSFIVTNTNDLGPGSLRAALANAAAAGSGNITFDPSDFNAAQTINSASTLTLPSNTTITGARSGSGLTLTNLVTVAGGGSSTDYPVFTVGSGVTGATINGLIIANGNSSDKGGGIHNSGALTLANSWITGNYSSIWGGGVYSNGPITITDTTMTNNSSYVQGGAFTPDGTTATITNSTFTGNTSFYGGGIYNVHGTVKMTNVTVANNHATFTTNDLYDLGSLTIANTVIGDLTSLNGPTDNGGNVIGNTGLNLAPLGNYGGPTQTVIPLPGSTAICAGTTTNWNTLSPKADQRGITTSDPNCASGAVDSGALQSNFSISVSTDASNVAVNTAMSPAPAIQLDESGSAFTVTATPLPTVTIPLTLTGAGTLTGGSASIDDSTGIATYSGLEIDTASMSDKLTANLTLTSGINPAVVLSVKTSSFEVLGGASSMTANTGTTPQSTTIGTAFTHALAVTVLDSANDPVQGASVTFTAPSSGASGKFSNSTTTITVPTGSNGVASAPFTANNIAGNDYTVTASAAGVTTVNFDLTNTAGAASTMTANAGTTPQSTTVGTAFTNALAVTVEDAFSNPVSGVSVTFTAPGSGASGKFGGSTTTTVQTNASGVASAPFTANSTAGGPYTVSATSAGLTAASFSLTNTAGAASTMTANAGTTPQTATVLTAFGNALAVTVEDAFSNPVSGVSVTFTAPGSGASGKFSNNTATITVPTNSSGVATAPITANSTAGGPYTATASAAGLTAVNFSLTNTAGAASSMTANAGTTPQSALVNAAFANPLAVTVKDASSNPVSGVSVTFTGPGSGASGTFSNSTNTIMATTNTSGVASAGFTANNTPGGPYTVSATAAGLTAVNFSLTNTPATLSVTCSATNSGTVNVAFSSGAESVTGGVQPYTFYVGSGAVPNGLMLNTSNGAVSGTPLTSGIFSISVKDSANTVAATSCPFTITAPALVITWPTPAAITYGTPLSATQLDATANATGSFSYNPPATTVLTAGSHQLSATFTPTDTKDYSVTTVHVTQVVNKATPVVSWSPAPLQIGSKLTSAQLDATANVPGKFVYTPALGTTITSSTETLKVVFTPTDTTDYNSVTQTVSLEVTVITVSPLSLNFGTVYLDSITTKDVTVSNLGSVPVNVSTPLISILTAGDSREFVAVNLCLQPLQPHKSCTIQVSYVAGPFYHQQTASMSVKYNSAGSPQTVSLTALTIDPEAKLSASGLSFGTQKEGTSSAAKTITLTNPGATALTIDSVTVTGSDPHDFLLANHCSSSLASGASCSIGVTFKPGAKGARSAKLVVQDNAKNSPQSATLSGSGD